MSRKASPTVIGSFVIGAAVLAVIAVTYFGSGKFLKKTNTRVLYFEGSLKGLDVGAPVLYKGVPVGSVSDIVLEFHVDDGTTAIPVYIELEPDSIVFVGDAPRDDDRQLNSLIERGMRAQLAAQSLLTGKMFILFDMHPDTPIVLRGDNPHYIEIPTIPSMMEEMTGVLERLQKIPIEQLVADLRHAIQGADELVRSPDLAHAIVSVDEAVQSFNKLALTVNAEVKPISTSIQKTAEAVRGSLKNLDEKLTAVEEVLNGTLREFQKLAQDVDAQIEPLMSKVNQVADAATGALEQAQSTLKMAEDQLSPDSELLYRLTSTLEEFSAMARSMRILASYLEQHPEALLQGKSTSGAQ